MAKSIYICSKNVLSPSIDKKLIDICNRLSPDNIKPRTPIVKRNERMALAVMNPTDKTIVDNNSLLLGTLYSNSKNWQLPNTNFPDGSFALFRNSEDYCEVVSDAAGSRTIWYYFDDDIFVSSTSQRAIIMFINSFEFNENVIPWMLSSGSLGHDNAWDKRINRIQPNSSIILNKLDWCLNKRNSRIEFHEKKLSDINHKNNLYDRLKETFDELQLDYSNWFLPLSGGYDSRGILCFLSRNLTRRNNIKTITWGLTSALNDIESDAYIAKELSKHYKVSHKYYSTDQTDEPIEKIFNRFLSLGEGRVDHISGYMDGFKIWKTLYEDGVQGIIRGDEGFGWNDGAISSLYVRLSTSSSLCKDISNLRNYRKYGIPKQQFPAVLQRRRNETLPTWRDRIYHEYRLPIIIASLTDLKLSYVEQISPLLSRNILDYVRQLPDHLRTNKLLFKEIVNDFELDINYATKEAIASPINILKTQEATNLLERVLSSDNAKDIFEVDFLNKILSAIGGEKTKSKVKASGIGLKSLLDLAPNILKNLIRKYIIRPKLDYNVIAFRIYIICIMHQLLLEDSNFNG